MTEIIGISERIAVIKLELPYREITIIQVYAPTENSTNEEIEQFYNNLEEIYHNHRSETNFIIGDFNSKIGKQVHSNEATVGPYGIGERNECGNRLIQFAEAQNLKTMNSFFNKQPEHKWTWRSPDGKTKNEIDFILTEKRENIVKLTVLNNLAFDSDHRMVRASINVRKRSRKIFQTRRIQLKTYNEVEYKTQLEENITRVDFTKIKIQESYTALEKCIIKSIRPRSTKKETKTERKHDRTNRKM